MIGRAFPFGKGFLGLVNYLETGAAGEERERVAWIDSRNLPTRRADAAARLMAATAKESRLTQRPVYHLSISFDPGDPVDRKGMTRVADAVLRRLGLSEHQAIYFAHKDTRHPHLHIVVNRVHPVHHRAWERGWDWPKIEAELRTQEVELGLRVVPGKLARVPGREPAPALVRGDALFLHRANRQAAPVLEAAQSWAEVEQGLAAVGLAVRVKGGGLTIHDGRQEVKASDVGRAFSRNNLEKRLGKLSGHRLAAGAAPPLVPSREPEPVRAPEREPIPPPAPLPPDESLHALLDAEHQRLQGAGLLMQLRRVAELLHQERAYRLKVREHAKTVKERNDAGTEVERLEGLDKKAREEARALGEVLGRVYTERGEAARKLVDYGRQFGTDLTQGVFELFPERFGTLRKAGGWRSALAAWDEAPARGAARDGAERVATAVGHWLAKPPEDELDATRTHLAELTEAELAARAAKDALSGTLAREREITAALRSLLSQVPPWWVRQQLARLLPPEGYEEAANLTSRAYQAALEGRERRRSGYEH